MSKKTRKNPGFMFFANDALAWEPINFLTDEQLGQAFKLIVYGCKLGGSLPKGHPLLELLDPKVLSLCTRKRGAVVEVIAPHDLPRLMARRQQWCDSRKAGAEAAGRGAGGKFGGSKR